MAVQIQIRRDAAANWTSVNPILAQGELGYETDTGKFKIGDGVTAWSSLTYDILTLAEKGAANGIAPLNGSGKIDSSYLAITATTDGVGYQPSLKINNPTHLDTVQEILNHQWSAGIVEGCGLTDNGNGTINIASGFATLRGSASEHADLYSISVNAETSIVLTDNTTNYVYLNYNSGTPSFAVTTDISNVNGLDKCLAYVIHRSGNDLNVVTAIGQNVDTLRKMTDLFRGFSTFIHGAGGSLLYNPSTTTIGVTDGKFYFQLSEVPHTAFDTSVAGTANANVFTLWYRNGSGGFTSTANQKTVTTTTYDSNTGTPTTLGNNKYGVTWFYIVHDDPSSLHAVMGQAEYATEAEAKVASPPASLPSLLSGMGTILGSVVYIKSGSTFLDVLSAFSTAYNPSMATNHNGLAGIQGGVVGEYNHLSNAELSSVGLIGGKTNMTGFPVDSSGNYLTTLTYNETTRTVTVAPTGASFDIFVGGVKYTKTSTSQIHTDVHGAHFVYFDQSGAITHSTTAWDILLHVPIAYVFWDATNNRGICLDERHHAGRDLYWHRNQHFAEGTKATSGFTIGDYTLSNGSTDTATTYSIASGVAEDEDIKITTSALPDNGPYTILERVGVSGDWQITRTSVRPYLDNGTALQYNQNNGGTWQRTVCPEDTFVNYYIFAATSIPTSAYTPSPTTTQQIFIVPGQTTYASEALASGEGVGNLSWGTIPLTEVVPLYQIILRYNAAAPTAYTNTAKCAILRVTRLLGTSVTITQSAQADHGALAGLADDDHTQYVLADGTRTITGSSIISVNSASDALRITQTGAGNALLVEDGANPDSSPFAVTATGNVLVGKTTSLGTAAGLQVYNNESGLAGVSVWADNTSNNGASLNLRRSRGTIPGSFNLVTNGDLIGAVLFQSADGVGLFNSAKIESYVDGVAALNDTPGNLVFSTTADGSTTPVERMRISQAGYVGIGTNNPLAHLDIVNTTNQKTIKTTSLITSSPANFDLQEMVAINATVASAGVTFSGADPRLMALTLSPSNEVVFRGNKVGMIAIDYIPFYTNALERVRIAQSGAVTVTNDLTIYSATAIPVGGTAGSGYKFSSTSNFGTFFGSGAPTLAAAKGSLYLRSNGTTDYDRTYVNTDGSTTWTALAVATHNHDVDTLSPIRPSLLLDFANGKYIDARITFARASTGTYYGADGLLKTAAINGPRFDHDPVTGASKGLLIEEARTNLLTYSEQFDNVVWVKSNATITTNATVSPDGNVTADKLVEDSSLANHNVVIPSTVFTSGVTYTLSLYAKAGERSSFEIMRSGPGGASAQFDLVNVVAASLAGSTPSITAVGNGWYRCIMTWTSTSSTPRTHNINIQSPYGTASYTGDGTSGIYIWGVQLEAGAFPTSYIPTTTASATRSADVAIMTGTNFSSWYNQTQGTLIADAMPTTVSGTHPWLSMNDVTANERIELRGTTTNPELYVIDGVGNSTTIDAGTLAANTGYTMAAALSANDLAVSLDGATVVTGSETMPTTTQMQIGTDGTNYLNGTIARIAYYPRRLANEVLQGLST